MIRWLLTPLLQLAHAADVGEYLLARWFHRRRNVIRWDVVRRHTGV